MLYLIAYDIADPKRLGRVARRLERSALRVQKSVFLFRGERAGLETLLDQLAELIHSGQDVVQAWQLAAAETPSGLVRGLPPGTSPGGVVLGSGGMIILPPSA